MKEIQGKTILGVMAQVREIPVRPDGPALACRIQFDSDDALAWIPTEGRIANKSACNKSRGPLEFRGFVDYPRFGGQEL